MTNRRRRVQIAHERFVVNDFLNKFNHWHHSDFKVIEEPNPPEAIIQSSRGTRRRLEVTDAFWSDAFAKDLFSYATDGEIHAPSPEGVFVSPSEEFASRFVDVVRKKLEKGTYQGPKQASGLGYLIVSIHYPLFNKHDFLYIQRAWSEVQVNDLGCFRSIYLHYRTFNDYALTKWATYSSMRKTPHWPSPLCRGTDTLNELPRSQPSL